MAGWLVIAWMLELVMGNTCGSRRLSWIDVVDGCSNKNSDLVETIELENLLINALIMMHSAKARNSWNIVEASSALGGAGRWPLCMHGCLLDELFGFRFCSGCG